MKSRYISFTEHVDRGNLRFPVRVRGFFPPNLSYRLESLTVSCSSGLSFPSVKRSFLLPSSFSCGIYLRHHFHRFASPLIFMPFPYAVLRLLRSVFWSWIALKMGARNFAETSVPLY